MMRGKGGSVAGSGGWWGSWKLLPGLCCPGQLERAWWELPGLGSGSLPQLRGCWGSWLVPGTSSWHLSPRCLLQCCGCCLGWDECRGGRRAFPYPWHGLYTSGQALSLRLAEGPGAVQEQLTLTWGFLRAADCNEGDPASPGGSWEPVYSQSGTRCAARCLSVDGSGPACLATAGGEESL